MPEIVGGGYGTFWRFKGRYRVVKGSRASKKSKTTALYYISSLMKYPAANLLVIRKVYRTLKDSCYTDLKWAADRLGVLDQWEFKESPLEATYKPTGQKILFRGLDDPLKVTSITVPHGQLCWAWIEEAYEINDENAFDMLDESIRGCTEVFKQITLTFNPWNERHWLKRRFFDEETGRDSEGNPIYTPRENPISADGSIMAITTNYLCNEYLDNADLAKFEDMKRRKPARYKVAGLGEWGITEGVIFEDWEERAFTLEWMRQTHPGTLPAFGGDFGFTNDPTACFVGYYDKANKVIFVWDEFYKTGLTNTMIAQEITAAGYIHDTFTWDSAEPKSIAELKAAGVKARAADKGKGSINAGISAIQDCHIIVHPRCVNFLTEIQNYTWAKDRFGKPTNTPIDSFNHLMDAMRYGITGASKPVPTITSFKL